MLVPILFIRLVFHYAFPEGAWRNCLRPHPLPWRSLMDRRLYLDRTWPFARAGLLSAALMIRVADPMAAYGQAVGEGTGQGTAPGSETTPGVATDTSVFPTPLGAPTDDPTIANPQTTDQRLSVPGSAPLTDNQIFLHTGRCAGRPQQLRQRQSDAIRVERRSRRAHQRQAWTEPVDRSGRAL